LCVKIIVIVHTREILRKWVLQACIWNFQIEAVQTHVYTQMNNTQPIYAVSTHNYAPKVARVIETLGELLETHCAYKQKHVTPAVRTRKNVDSWLVHDDTYKSWCLVPESADILTWHHVWLSFAPIHRTQWAWFLRKTFSWYASYSDLEYRLINAADLPFLCPSLIMLYWSIYHILAWDFMLISNLSESSSSVTIGRWAWLVITVDEQNRHCSFVRLGFPSAHHVVTA
jgi:hypothetical protein